MSLLAFEGFEDEVALGGATMVKTVENDSGVTTTVEIQESATYTTDNPRSGTKSLHVGDALFSAFSSNAAGALPSVIAGLGVFPTAIGASGYTMSLGFFIDGSNALQFAVQLLDTGDVQISCLAVNAGVPTGGALDTLVGAVDLDVYAYWELSIVIGASTAAVEVRKDGAVVFSDAAVDTGGYDGTASVLSGFDARDADASGDENLDDFYMISVDETEPVGYLHDVAILAVLPDSDATFGTHESDGTKTGAPGGTDFYEYLDEAVPNGTDYIAVAEAGPIVGFPAPEQPEGFGPVAAMATAVTLDTNSPLIRIYADPVDDDAGSIGEEVVPDGAGQPIAVIAARHPQTDEPWVAADLDGIVVEMLED